MKYKKPILMMLALACAGLGVFFGVIDQDTALEIIKASMGM